ncbi:hypothetical protein FALCPG4_015020 [Fusarium falciforme]
MTFDLWTYQFCLACDKQVQSDGAAYCSETCKMVDSERATLPPNSQVSSPGFPPPPTKFSALQASLGSMQSTPSTNETGHLSNKARMELRAYAVSFGQATMQRRRPY